MTGIGLITQVLPDSADSWANFVQVSWDSAESSIIRSKSHGTWLGQGSLSWLDRVDLGIADFLILAWHLKMENKYVLWC